MNIEEFRKLGFRRYVEFEKAREDFLLRCEISREVELVELKKSIGRIVYEDVHARVSIPSFAKSAMDGYAVKANDTFMATIDKPKIVELDDSISIGEWKVLSLNDGHAIRVATGAMIPEGSDAVIEIEATEIDKKTKKIKIFKPVYPGKNIIVVGEDYKKDDLVLEAGHQITPQDVSVLASLGIKALKVVCKPRVSILSTGNELISLDALRETEGGLVNLDNLVPGKIINSNYFMIRALVESAGGEVVYHDTLPDDEDSIKNAIDKARLLSDFIILTGGTSVGEKDMLPVVMGKYNEIIHHGIAMRPGSATLLGLAGNKPVICVSGFPVAAEVGMLYFGMPGIRKIMGAKNLDIRPCVPVKLAIPVAVKGFGVRRFLRVRIVNGKDINHASLPSAVPVKLSGSNVQRSMVESDGIIDIPENVEGYEAGVFLMARLHPRQ
ncbi:MAG: molybdopterin molybdotransferase MoeA [Promethearchaeota archaeon]